MGDTDVGDNAELKNLKELAICAAGLGARQATFQDANTHSLALLADVKKSRSGVPLHATFLANVHCGRRLPCRLVDEQSSPYFHFFQTTSLELLQWTLETQITATNARADAPHIEQGERSAGALAVRAAQKTVGLMKEGRRQGADRPDPRGGSRAHGSVQREERAHNARKAKLFDDISEAEEKVLRLKETGDRRMKRLASCLADQRTSSGAEQQLQHAFVQTGKIADVSSSTRTPTERRRCCSTRPAAAAVVLAARSSGGQPAPPRRRRCRTRRAR